MDPHLPVDVLSRWFHIGTVIVLIGGSVFMRFVLMPAADTLPDEPHQKLRESVVGRWRKIVGIGIGLILLSGLYNYHRGAQSHPGQLAYHILIGTKIVLALVVFFLGSALVGRSAKLEPIRQNRKKWLGVLILLAAVIVAISGYVKVALKPTPASSGTASETAAE